MQNDRQKLTIYASGDRQQAEAPKSEPVILPQARGRRLTRGERLLQNSAIACAMLLGILSLRNVEHPWAQAASNAVEKALTVDFDVDETLGELQFVKRFLPESTLVFWNLNDADRLTRPVSGVMIHEYSDEQPWYLFAAGQGEDVLCGKSGQLASAEKTQQGDWALKVEHADGSCTVYAYVDRGTIEVGESVRAGEVLTSTALQGCMYLEYQREGAPAPVEEFAQ